MSTITFDTLRYVRQLEASGIAPQQAEAFVIAQRDILSEALEAALVSKSDIRSVRDDIAILNNEWAVLKWMTGLVMAGVAAQVLKSFFS